MYIPRAQENVSVSLNNKPPDNRQWLLQMHSDKRDDSHTKYGICAAHSYYGSIFNSLMPTKSSADHHYFI